MKETPNIGQTGVESIRIGGMKISDLPLAAAARAKEQLRLAEDTERQNKINDVMAKYPHQTVLYLKSRITECHENIARLNAQSALQTQMIADYAGHISMSKQRDKSIDALDAVAPDFEERKKKLIKQFGPYVTSALEAQVLQCQEALIRFDRVIAQENASITEHEKYVSLCEQRDRDLKNLGVSATK